MAKYAENTTVSPEKSLAEIQATLKRYGATQFGFLDQGQQMTIAFEMRGRRVRLTIPLPPLADFQKDGRGARRAMQQQIAARDQAIRQRFRALLIVVKAKLESVESGIETFEQAFASHLVLPNGQTLGEYILPQIDEAYKTGKMPSLLLSSGG